MKIEGALKARGNKMPNLVRRARDKSYTDIVRTSSSFASCTPSTPPTSAATPAELSTPSSLPLPSPTPSTSVSGLGRVPASRLMREDHPKPVPVSAQVQTATSKVMHDGHVMGEWQKLIPGILNDSKSYSNKEILYNLRQAAGIIQQSSGIDYWITDDGQSELLRRIQADSKPPSSAPHSWGRSTGVGSSGLSPLSYTKESEAMIGKSSLSPVSPADEWIEVELTADSGACDTVIPRKTAESIPILPSLASLRGMEYEVANGQSIPNLGERRCLVWTENATDVKKMTMQVADVHKGLLSLSRCADMGFEGRFGRIAGALVCERTGEVIPLTRKGNLYVLRVWIKAAPFGRQEPS